MLISVYKRSLCLRPDWYLIRSLLHHPPPIVQIIQPSVNPSLVTTNEASAKSAPPSRLLLRHRATLNRNSSPRGALGRFRILHRRWTKFCAIYVVCLLAHAGTTHWTLERTVRWTNGFNYFMEKLPNASSCLWKPKPTPIPGEPGCTPSDGRINEFIHFFLPNASSILWKNPNPLRCRCELLRAVTDPINWSWERNGERTHGWMEDG